MLLKWVQTSKALDEAMMCVHSCESHQAILFCGTVYFAVQVESNFKVHGWNRRE